MPRDVFQAWHRDEDVACPVCIVTINTGFMNYVEWIWTHELYRRQRIATEVLRAIEQVIGSVTIEGVTEVGEAFAEAIYPE